MKIISSTINQEIKEVAKLIDKRGREQQKKFLAEGLRTISTLIQSDLELEKIYCTEENLEKIEKLSSKINDDNLVLIRENVLERITAAQTPSGIVAVFKIPEQKPLENLEKTIVLAEIQDPGNLGTLVRTAAATGFKKIALVNTCDIWNPKVIQASAGTIGFLEIYKSGWANVFDAKKNKKLCALVVKNGQSPKDVNFNEAVLVIGNEAHGISEEFLKDCELKLTLPMSGQVESLNAAVAGSIAMYLANN